MGILSAALTFVNFYSFQRAHILHHANIGNLDAPEAGAPVSLKGQEKTRHGDRTRNRAKAMAEKAPILWLFFWHGRYLYLIVIIIAGFCHFRALAKWIARASAYHFRDGDGDGDGDEFVKRMSQWHGFELSSFFIAENSKSEIVGFVFPWISSKTRRLVVDSLPLGIRIMGCLMPLVGKPCITTGKELKVLYLTHLEIASRYSDLERQTIFELLL
jgi:hypothetical protein